MGQDTKGGYLRKKPEISRDHSGKLYRSGKERMIPHNGPPFKPKRKEEQGKIGSKTQALSQIVDLSAG